MIRSKILIKGDSKTLKTYLEALKPEAGDDLGRASYSIRKGLTGIVIKVRSEDVTSFRAALTSLLGTIAIVDKTISEVKKD